MYNGEKIRQLLRDMGIKNKELQEALGWKNNNQLKQVIEGNPGAETLEKICDFLKVPIDALFDRPDYGNHNIEKEQALLEVIEQQKKTIDALHELLRIEKL